MQVLSMVIGILIGLLLMHFVRNHENILDFFSHHNADMKHYIALHHFASSSDKSYIQNFNEKHSNSQLKHMLSGKDAICKTMTIAKDENMQVCYWIAKSPQAILDQVGDDLLKYWSKMDIIECSKMRVFP